METEIQTTRHRYLRWFLPLALFRAVGDGWRSVREALERVGLDRQGRAALLCALVACVLGATLLRATALYGPAVVIGALVVGMMLAWRMVRRDLAEMATPVREEREAVRGAEALLRRAREETRRG